MIKYTGLYLSLVLPKQPNQPTPVAASAASVSETQVPNQDMAVIQAALKCMLPGCDKPCSIQPSGHVHDFCSREHALAYNDAQKKPIVPPKANGMLI